MAWSSRSFVRELKERRFWTTHANRKWTFVFLNYRIYSINRPGRLLIFWTLRVGAYSRWALTWGLALIKFLPFLASEVCLFCNKTINANNKTRRSNKATFLWNTLKKTPSSGKSLIRIYSLKWGGWEWALVWVWLRWGGGGRLFEAERLLTFSAFRTGAYSRWALIRSWALIRINTVYSVVGPKFTWYLHWCLCNKIVPFL